MSSLKYFLDEIQIVMVNTTLPANIGSAARAMHTMGLSNLSVINPKFPIDESSYSHAAGGDTLLEHAKIIEDIHDAIADSQLVFAASSRNRHVSRPLVNPLQASEIMAKFLVQHRHIDEPSSNTCQKKPKISILFGREDRGLTNDELALADYHIQIDANPNYPVLNVASAVQVISSFIYHYFSNNNFAGSNNQEIGTVNLDSTEPFAASTAAEMTHIIRQKWDEAPITHAQQLQLNQRIIELMQSLALADTQNLGLLPNRLSRLTSRLQLDKKEYQLISAIIGKLQQSQTLSK